MSARIADAGFWGVSMDWLVLLVALAAVFGGLGTFIAAQKRRGAAEGFVLGFLFGPLGVLVELFLPQGERNSIGDTLNAGVHRNINELGAIAEIAERFRCTLEETDLNWQRLPYRRKRQILSSAERKIMNDLRLSAAVFNNYAPEARRAVLGTESR
jgi:hypothetical protein